MQVDSAQTFELWQEQLDLLLLRLLDPIGDLLPRPDSSIPELVNPELAARILQKSWNAEWDVLLSTTSTIDQTIEPIAEYVGFYARAATLYTARAPKFALAFEAWYWSAFPDRPQPSAWARTFIEQYPAQLERACEAERTQLRSLRRRIMSGRSRKHEDRDTAEYVKRVQAFPELRSIVIKRFHRIARRRLQHDANALSHSSLKSTGSARWL